MTDKTLHPVYETERASLYISEAEAFLTQQEAESVQLAIISPPYDDMRSYGGDIAFDIQAIARQLWRVIKVGGAVVWIVTDGVVKKSESLSSFRHAMAMTGCDIPPQLSEEDEVALLSIIDNQSLSSAEKLTRIHQFYKGYNALMPHQTEGFLLHATQFLRRVNQRPLQKNRYERSVEYMFVFSKGQPSVFNGIRVPTKHVGKIQRRTGRDMGKDKLVQSENITKRTKLKDNVFEYVMGSGQSTYDEIAFNHPATFHEGMVADQIVTWSKEGDTVLDIMAGSGTVVKVAVACGRIGKGCDINADYITNIAVPRVRDMENQLNGKMFSRVRTKQKGSSKVYPLFDFMEESNNEESKADRNKGGF